MPSRTGSNQEWEAAREHGQGNVHVRNWKKQVLSHSSLGSPLEHPILPTTPPPGQNRGLQIPSPRTTEQSIKDGLGVERQDPDHWLSEQSAFPLFISQPTLHPRCSINTQMHHGWTSEKLVTVSTGSNVGVGRGLAAVLKMKEGRVYWVFYGNDNSLNSTTETNIALVCELAGIYIKT